MTGEPIVLADAVRELGEYSAQFVTWDKLAAGDVVLSQGGLAVVLGRCLATADPEHTVTWRMRSLHNGAEYELPMFRELLTAVVRRPDEGAGEWDVRFGLADLAAAEAAGLSTAQVIDQARTTREHMRRWAAGEETHRDEDS
jgi:hypothetical protein